MNVLETDRFQFIIGASLLQQLDDKRSKKLSTEKQYFWALDIDLRKPISSDYGKTG
jgi:hypothetical protein